MEEAGYPLGRELQEHSGLSAYESRVLLAGTATNIELALVAVTYPGQADPGCSAADPVLEDRRLRSGAGTRR